MPKNILVQYKGGGYDGCFWEWNYFAFDNEGNFHVVAASGCAGIKTVADALELLLTSDKYHVYDLTSKSEIHSFCNSTAKPYVLGVAKFFNDGNDNPNASDYIGSYDFPSGEFTFPCDSCGREVTDGILEDFHGCGGVAMTADTLVCEECESAGSCSTCNEYIGADKLDQYGDCEFCAKEHLKKVLKTLSNSEGIVYLTYDRFENRFIEACAHDVMEDETEDAGRLRAIFVTNTDTFYVLRSFTESEAYGAVSDFLSEQNERILESKAREGSISEIIDVITA